MSEPHDVPTPSRPLRWIALGGGALFLFSDPWLSLFNHRTLIGGIPLILVYLFGTLALLIALSARMPPCE